ncbi:alpha/beta fold hydrolase [Rossellomorea sp. NPDC077527]|uniref:alpha/beta fold hydrolase n=1 Tax=Rossellomorea sp. NPDC077527 TaxID=3364510 RepID=UPI0037C74769
MKLDDSEGEIVIKRVYFLHGFMGTGETHFSNQVSSLGDGYEAILIDLPGHGNSPVEASDNYFEDALKYVISQMKQEGEVFLVGLSLGASLAIHIALREPELVKGIVLTGYSPYIPEELISVMEKQYEFFLNIEENDKETAEYFMSLHGDKWHKTLKKVLYQMTYKYPSATPEEIKSIRVPMLILNGSNEMHEVEAAAYMKKLNNDIRVGLVPDTGHTVNIEEPAIYNKILTTFLEANL